MRASHLGALLTLSTMMLCGASWAQPVGGYRTVPVTSKDVMTAAQFAIDAKNKKDKENFTLQKIVQAESQVVAGTNYKLKLEAGVEGGTRDAEVVVWAKLDRTHELTSWTWKSAVKPASKN